MSILEDETWINSPEIHLSRKIKQSYVDCDGYIGLLLLHVLASLVPVRDLCTVSLL